MRSSCHILVGVLAAGAFLYSPAQAHFSIIRQGLESRGVIEAGDQHGRVLAAGDFNGDAHPSSAWRSSTSAGA